MSAKAIREYDGKRLLMKYLDNIETRCIQITSAIFDSTLPDISWASLEKEHPWVLDTQLVVKPDQLIKRRGKANLLLLNENWENVKDWITKRMSRQIQVEQVNGILDHFIVEPFVRHKEEEEYYICIQSNRNGEEILFHHEGGVEVGDIDKNAFRLQIGLKDTVKDRDIIVQLLHGVEESRKEHLAGFMKALLEVYRELNFVYMEINPLVMLENHKIVPLDMAAKLDETAAFLCGTKWGDITFPPPFGRAKFKEENYIQELDSKTGASLKLTILNHQGRIWTMVAGGGASVVYADTISDLGFGQELANYGEYSGAPSEDHTFAYACTILDLMTREYDERGKVLIVGGGIANFTDVALTFRGIIKAINAYQEQLKANKVHIWVRRGGPNYKEGLRNMQKAGEKTGVPIQVYGPETHITAIVPMALGLVQPGKRPSLLRRQSSCSSNGEETEHSTENSSKTLAAEHQTTVPTVENIQDGSMVRFHTGTKCIVYGLQQRAVQGMLDFDYLCNRNEPSVAAMIFPFSGNHFIKFHWGTDEVLIPVYQSIDMAVKKHDDVSMLVNFSSFRSVYSSTMEALKYPDILKTHAIIAEGVPESQTRLLVHEANAKNVGIIGPATVGGIKPGCLRIGNTGGMLDNIVQAKLYRPGSVAYVSKSGGMSNELNNIISHCTNGVYEGVAIGGDRYPGSKFIDHLLRYQDNVDVKMMVLLGEVGGVDEFEVCKALKSGRITKPLVAWCIGTCAKIFPFEVQFGHAGACAQGESETADAKNMALKQAGAIVPDMFDTFGTCIESEYKKLVASGDVIEQPEMPVPSVPMDYAWAKNLGLVRKPANFISSISDDRGDEVSYSGMGISDVFDKEIGVGGVLGLLWFKRRFPPYATKFIEMVLMVTADHGPAVSGAHNTIVTARAGKDLISSLVSGLLTIGPRFGGALDSAAKMFSEACDAGLSPTEFVNKTRKENKLIMGIGHRIKSLQNPDKRVTIIKDYAHSHFAETTILDYALEVEQVTTRKRSNLILNVDGCIAVCFVDLLRSCGAFTKEESDDHIEHGCLNGLFVLGRSIGFIGHYLDQNRLKQPLYRHPWDDISYM